MFYIKHVSDSFSIIDCCLNEANKKDVVHELKILSHDKGVTRFISTHPDDDHIRGLQYLNQEMPVRNFYCVENNATKADKTDDFKEYCKLRDGEKSFLLHKGCNRNWMNQSNHERGSAGITILWPVVDNEHYKQALREAACGGSPNNISPIIKYSLESGVKALWMGDLETDFMEDITDSVSLGEIDILFAPHHGRDSGKVPKSWLDQLKPKIIVIGEAPSNHLNYYSGFNTIKQNSAGDILFECVKHAVHIYVSEKSYEEIFLEYDCCQPYKHSLYYLGTLEL